MDEQRHTLSGARFAGRLGGIKFSERQAHISFSAPHGDGDPAALLADLSRKRHNLSRLFLRGKSVYTSDLSIDSSDFKKNRQWFLEAFAQHNLEPDIAEPAGTITLFPHGSHIPLLLRVLQAVDSGDLPINGIYSSLSAIAISVSYEMLDRAASMLLEQFSLPTGHSPFRYEPSELDRALTGGSARKVETIAQYWEPRIRIYGSTLKRSLTMLSFHFPRKQLGALILGLSQSPVATMPFEMAALIRDGDGLYDLQLLLDGYDSDKDDDGCGQHFSALESVDWAKQSALEVLYFHGPHFQDRYGVAALAVGALQDASAGFLSINCCGTSIHLVSGERDGDRAAAALSDVFVVP